MGDFDYRALEPLLLGWLSGDERFLLAFSKGRGYIDVAKWLFAKDIEEGTAEYKATKSIILGTNYNMQGAKLARVLKRDLGRDVSLTAAEGLRRKYLSTFPRVAKYMEDRRAELLRAGQVVSATGRIRRLPCPDGAATPGLWRMGNQAINFPIQSLASDVTGSALVDVERALLAEHGVSLQEHYQTLALTSGTPDVVQWKVMGYSLIMNEVHDSLVVDLHPGSPSRDREIIIDTMRAVPTLRRFLGPGFGLTLNVSTKIGGHWGQ